MRKRIILCMIALCLSLPALTSCKDTGNQNAGIKILVNEEMTSDSAVVQIPEFTASDEEIKKKLRDLEKETKALKKTAEKELKKNTGFEMRSYLSDNKNYPQVTVVWHTSEEDGRIYNLVTLGADNTSGEPITCREVLDMAQMSGVDLSLNVGRLVQESDIRGELLTMEMQGFSLGEKGEVEDIYMKITLRTGEEDEEKEEEHFFSYNLKEDTLTRLSEKGFDIP